jgi:hypothetical protein
MQMSEEKMKEMKVLKASSIILHHIGVYGIEARPSSITIKLRDKIFAEDLIKNLKENCSDKIEYSQDKIVINKRDIPDIYDSLYEKIVAESNLVPSSTYNAKIMSDIREVNDILDNIKGTERAKITPSLIKDLSELIKKNKDDSNLRMGLKNIAEYCYDVNVFHEAIKVLKEVKYNVGRVAFYLGINPGIAPWDFIEIVKLVEKNKDDENKLWELCNDLDEGYPAPDIARLKQKYGM